MYSLLVLGMIPGTNIQLSFWAWLAIIIFIPVFYRRYKTQLKRLTPYIDEFLDLGRAPSPRLPLPARRLHRRPQASYATVRLMAR